VAQDTEEELSRAIHLLGKVADRFGERLVDRFDETREVDQMM
jgi:hypothetical protein